MMKFEDAIKQFGQQIILVNIPRSVQKREFLRVSMIYEILYLGVSDDDIKPFRHDLHTLEVCSTALKAGVTADKVTAFLRGEISLNDLQLDLPVTINFDEIIAAMKGA